jgi:hypothetical protein
LNRLSPFSRYEIMKLRPKICSAYFWALPKSAALVAGLAIARAAAPRLTKIGAEIAASQPSAALPGQMFDLTR